MDVFVLIDDKWRSPEQWFFVKTFYNHDKEKFTRMNNEWYWVYKTVNAFDCSDEELKAVIDAWGWKTKRQIPFLKKLRYVYADLDVAKKWDWQTREEKEFKKKILLEALNWHCEPTMYIDTSNWIQPLRRINEDKIDEETQEKYIQTINWIIQWSKQHWASWDEVKDVTRVVRMPWYKHMKEEPYDVQIHWWGVATYTLEELHEKFPYDVVKKPVKIIDDSETSMQFKAVQELELVEVLAKAFSASWRSFEVDKQWRFIIDWRLTWNFFWKTGWDFVASTSHEDLSGNKITTVSKILWVTYSEAYKRIKDEFNIKSETELKRTVAPKVLPTKKTWWPKKFSETGMKKFTTWIPEINTQVWHMRPWELALLHWPSKNGKTFFAVSMLNENWLLKNKWVLFSLEMDREKLKIQQWLARAWIDRVSYETWNYTDEQWHLFITAYESFDELFTIIDENDLPPEWRDEWFTLDHLLWQIRKLHVEDNYDLFVIDSLKLVKWNNKWSDQSWESYVIKEARKLKNELPIVIVFIHHNIKWWSTWSGSQDLENFVDWRIEVTKKIDPDANGRTIFNQTFVRIFKERIGKELEFIFNWNNWNLIYQSSGYIEYWKS